MYNQIHRTFSLAIFAASFASMGHSSNYTAIGVYGDWSVMSSANPKECWAVTGANIEKAKHYRKGVQVDDVNRGEGTQLYATFTQSAEQTGSWLAFTGGDYQFDNNTPVSLSIGGQEFKLFIANDKERGWAYTSGTIDEAIIKLFKAGDVANLTSVSARGTTSVDEISLMGFTAAYEAAKKACK